MAKGYVCHGCKSKKNEGDKCYYVLEVSGCYLACCSNNCALDVQKMAIRYAEDRANKVKNYKIEEDIW